MDRALFIAEKVCRVKKELRRMSLDSLALTDKPSLQYLCGFFFEGSILLVTRARRPVLFIDSMNASLARKLSTGLGLDLVVCSGPKLPSLRRLLHESKAKRTGFNGDKVSVSMYAAMDRAVRPVKLCPESNGINVSGIVEGIRQRKNPGEIALIKKAASETLKIWNEVKRGIEPGMRETEIASVVDTAVSRRGYKTSFPTIAASGENTAFPHAIPTSKRVKANEHVLVDFGIIYNEYCSDLTRICCKGKMNPQIRAFKDVVLKAQEKAFKTIAPGVRISRVLGEVNKVFMSAGVSDNVLHGLGHGIGVEVHERPSLRQDNPGIFTEGMVITVEPGLYKTGLGGVREEDMVLVTSKGCEVLTV